jgi:hypothetical protein
MPYLTASVGRSGANRPHDVATIQATLRHLDLREGSRKVVLWSKPIDGRCSRELEQAIAKLQAVLGQRQTVRLEPGGPSLMEVNKIIRPRLRPLRGLDGTAVAFLGAGSDDDGDFLASVVGQGLLVPRRFVDALGKLIVALQRETKLLVVPKLCEADDKGRFFVRLTFEEDMTWIDPASGRLLPADEPPLEAVRKVIACARRIAGLEVTDGTDMLVRTPFALRCLAAPRRALDRERAQALDIEVPSEPLAQQLIGAGIQLVQNATTANDADPDLPTGEEAEAELADICDALKREHPRLSERLEDLRRQIREPFAQNRERVERLVREGRAGWVNDLLGDFVGNGESAILVQANTGQPVIDENGKHFSVPKISTSPQAIAVSDFIDHLRNNDLEGFFDFMYKDSGDNVTIGIGANLTAAGGPDDAVRLLAGKAFNLSTREFSSGQQIREAYTTVLNSPLQNNLGTPEEAEQFKPLTDVRITEADARLVAGVRFRRERGNTNTIDSRDHYPDFDHAPRNAQIVAFDIIYTNGGGGFDGYPRFRKAYNRKDWEQANIEQADGRDDNEQRMALIERMLADLTAAEPFFIDFDARRGQGVNIDDIDTP